MQMISMSAMSPQDYSSYQGQIAMNDIRAQFHHNRQCRIIAQAQERFYQSFAPFFPPPITQAPDNTSHDNSSSFTDVYQKVSRYKTPQEFNNHFHVPVHYTYWQTEKIFDSVGFYQYEPFLKMARTVDEWDDNIDELYKKLLIDHDYAQATREFEGYQSTFREGLRWFLQQKSRFHEDVEREYERIQKEKDEQLYKKRVFIKEMCETARKNKEQLRLKLRGQREVDSEAYYKKCEEIKNDLDAVTLIAEKNSELKELVELGKESIKESLEFDAEHNDEYAKRTFIRALTIQEAILDNHSNFCSKYSINSDIKNYAQQQNISLSPFDEFSGNRFQQLLVEEVATSLETAAPLFQYTQSNLCADSIASHLLLVAQRTCIASKRHEMRKAIALSDYGDSIAKVGRNFVNFLTSGYETIEPWIVGGVKGAASGAIQYAEQWGQLITNPPAALLEYWHSIKTAGWALTKVAQVIYNPAAYEDRLTKLYENFRAYARKNPEDASSRITSFLSQIFLCRKLDPKFFNACGILKSRLLKEAEAVKNAAEKSKKLQKVLAPISSVVETAHEYHLHIHSAVQKYKHLTYEQCRQVYDKCASFYRKTEMNTLEQFAELRKNCPWVSPDTFIHLNLGHFKKIEGGLEKLASGLHFEDNFQKLASHFKWIEGAHYIERNLPNNIIQRTLLGHIMANGKNKTKTFFPLGYQKEKAFSEAIRLSSDPKNFVKMKGNLKVFEGIADGNIKLIIHLNPDNSLNTFFPIV